MIIFFCLILMSYGIWLTKNDVFISSVQQSDSVIHTQVSVLFQILFPFRLLQNIEQRSLCCVVDPLWLSILNIAICTFPSQTPKLSLPPPPPPPSPSNHKWMKNLIIFNVSQQLPKIYIFKDLTIFFLVGLEPSLPCLRVPATLILPRVVGK